MVAATRSGVWLMDPDGRLIRQITANPEATARSRFNDGRVDPAGRLLVGTIDETGGEGAALYALDKQGPRPLVQGPSTSNGLAFSPDVRFLYHADTPRYPVWRYAYDVETGAVSQKSIFVAWDPSLTARARPDGAAIDMEGCYWVALYEGGRVQRYDPTGRLMADYVVPAMCPTMPAFGGPDRRTLYVTTGSRGRTEAELQHFPSSGGVFAMQVDTPGLPEPQFVAPVHDL